MPESSAPLRGRDIETLRLTRGEIDLINALDPENYDKLRERAPQMAIDAGVGLDSEQIWFNQVPSSAIPAYKKAWFASTRFRQAISQSINRNDLARVAFRGYARPAGGWISPANKVWFNDKLQPHRFDPGSALGLLRQDGGSGAGSIRLNIVTLDFPSLIERIARTFNYEACLLGFVNDDLDPNSQMNVWVSSAENHQWNPGEKVAATAWEAEIDRLMLAQASTFDFKKRKQAVDRVQQIVWEQEPFIYLVNKEALSAVFYERA